MENILITSTVLKYNLRGVEEKDLDKKIYRVMPVRYLYDMFERKKLVVPRVSSWEDPYENFFCKSNFIDKNGNEYSIKSIIPYIYGQCWTYNRDTDALWRIYSHEKQSIRIQTTIRKLFETVYENSFSKATTYVRPVTYIRDLSNWEKIKKTISLNEIGEVVTDSLFVKRNSFSHENEVRIICNDSGSKNSPSLALKEYDIEPNNFIEGITFDPRVEESYSVAYKRCFMEKYDYPGDKIRKSSLYTFDPMNISLD